VQLALKIDTRTVTVRMLVISAHWYIGDGEGDTHLGQPIRLPCSLRYVLARYLSND
jgi:hypothetical protein